MASSGKRKTTMAKLNRESRLRERRLTKEASKEARKQARIDEPLADLAGAGAGDQPDSAEPVVASRAGELIDA